MRSCLPVLETCVSMEILQLVICIPYKVSQRFCDVQCHRAVVFGKLFERPWWGGGYGRESGREAAGIIV